LPKISLISCKLPLVSRAFALLFTSWAIVELTYLPERLFARSHHLRESSVLVAHDYWRSYYLIVTVCLVFRLLALLMAAALFWRSGPLVQTLFSSLQKNQQAPVQLTGDVVDE
jgi:hypothetical protein